MLDNIQNKKIRNVLVIISFTSRIFWKLRALGPSAAQKVRDELTHLKISNVLHGTVLHNHKKK